MPNCWTLPQLLRILQPNAPTDGSAFMKEIILSSARPRKLRYRGSKTEPAAMSLAAERHCLHEQNPNVSTGVNQQHLWKQIFDHFPRTIG